MCTAAHCAAYRPHRSLISPLCGTARWAYLMDRYPYGLPCLHSPRKVLL